MKKLSPSLSILITWAEQVENREVESPSLFYMTVKEAITDTASMELTVEPMHIPYVTDINSASVSQDLEPSVIPYVANQPTDPQL